MAGEWPKTWSHARLGDVADVNWGDTSVTKASYLECGFPAYSATGPDGFLPYADYDRTGVILSAIGAECGRTWLARGKWSCIKNTIRFWSIRQDVDTEFLYWLTRDPSIWPKRGSAQPFISQGDARNLVVAYPPLTEQRAIAHILGTLDDKIDLNRRMNETLEAMARAIFKSWFVDFDPVRAKAEGRQPFGMDAETAALFPDSFQDSPLGKIPKGWKVGTLDEDFQLTMGQSPPGETYNEAGDGIPFFQGRADFGFRYPNVRVFCTAPTRQANLGDTLVSVRAPVGDINMALIPCAIGRGVAAVRHTTGSRSYTYYMMHALADEFSRFEAEGTVFGSISKQGFSSLKCIIPGSDIASAFERAAYPLDQAIENNVKQTETLSAIRDALLPKLVSGEIRVKDVNTTVEH